MEIDAGFLFGAHEQSEYFAAPAKAASRGLKPALLNGLSSDRL